jgi:hypothetical protein
VAKNFIRIKFIDDLEVKYNLPRWFCRLNYIALIPIIAWPLVFFGSIFMFDHPDNEAHTFLLFLLINSYPFVLFGIMLLSYTLYKPVKPVAIILPLISISALIYLISLIYLDTVS